LRDVTHADAFAGSPAWFHDGKQLVLHAAETAEVNKITSARRLRGTTQIVSIDLATQERRVLTSGPGEKLSPQWIAGREIAYMSRGTDGGIDTVAGGGSGRCFLG